MNAKAANENSDEPDDIDSALAQEANEKSTDDATDNDDTDGASESGNIVKPPNEESQKDLDNPEYVENGSAQTGKQPVAEHRSK